MNSVTREAEDEKEKRDIRELAFLHRMQKRQKLPGMTDLLVRGNREKNIHLHGYAGVF